MPGLVGGPTPTSFMGACPRRRTASRSAAVEAAFADGGLRPHEMGGASGLAEITQRVAAGL